MSFSIFADSFRSESIRKQRTIGEREVLRLCTTLDKANGEKAAKIARREILAWAQNRAGGKFPDAAWKHQEFEHSSGGRYCAVVRIVEQNLDIWAIRSDDPDKEIARRIWTTEATIAYASAQKALLSVRLLASSPEPKLNVEPAVPGFLRQLISTCELCVESEQLNLDPWIIKSENDTEHLINMLIDPNRRQPTFVMTVPENAINKSEPLVDPIPLVRSMLGIAKVVVLPDQFTWQLTNRFGKMLSVFGGAIRVYLPGFTEDSDPYGGHDLITANRLATEQDVLRVSVRLRQIAAHESLRRLRLGQDVLSYATVRAGSLHLKRKRLEDDEASFTEQLSAARKQIVALENDNATLRSEFDDFLSEHEELENKVRDSETKLTFKSYRIQQLEEQVATLGVHPNQDIPIPETWEDFPDWCEKYLADRVSLSPQARRKMRKSQFQNIEVAARCLLWLANDYRKQRLNGGDGDLRVQIGDGIQNARCGAHSFSFDWGGERFEVEWHLKNGANTRDPKRCLRIYYFWHDTSQEVVIASMPAHIRTGAT